MNGLADTYSPMKLTKLSQLRQVIKAQKNIISEQSKKLAEAQTYKADAELGKIAIQALKSITKYHLPAPSIEAHGWEAFANYAMAMATDKEFKAIKALKSIDKAMKG